MKHSIFAKVVLEDRESTAEFKKLSDGFFEHFQPEGRVELALVDKLVMLMWRQRRVVLAERGQIQSAYRFIEDNHRQNQIAEEQHRRERLSLNDGLLEGCEDPWTLKEAISQ